LTSHLNPKIFITAALIHFYVSDNWSITNLPDVWISLRLRSGRILEEPTRGNKHTDRVKGEKPGHLQLREIAGG